MSAMFVFSIIKVKSFFHIHIYHLNFCFLMTIFILLFSFLLFSQHPTRRNMSLSTFLPIRLNKREKVIVISFRGDVPCFISINNDSPLFFNCKKIIKINLNKTRCNKMWSLEIKMSKYPHIFSNDKQN